MKADYSDIKDLIDIEPVWYDQDGVPRYAKFHPDMCPDINADEVVLIDIQCQACSKSFMVEMHWNQNRDRPSFSEFLKMGQFMSIEYGDPPRHGHEKDGTISCWAGDTMLCEEMKIAEFWQRKRKWKRLGKYEVNLDWRTQG